MPGNEETGQTEGDMTRTVMVMPNLSVVIIFPIVHTASYSQDIITRP
jgi:hypothetical protein